MGLNTSKMGLNTLSKNGCVETHFGHVETQEQVLKTSQEGISTPVCEKKSLNMPTVREKIGKRKSTTKQHAS